jgi:hypothetical protein
VKSGKCANDRAFVGLGGEAGKIIFYPFWEDGDLSEAIKEGFEDFGFNKLKTALFESKLSKKRIKEIIRIFVEELEDAFINWTESIDGSVSAALQNYDFELSESAVGKIADPSDFHCKHFE